MYEMIVSEMTCMHCVNTVTQAIKKIDANAEVQIDLVTQKVRVSSRLRLENLVAAIEDAGFPVISQAAVA
jgi:copper chaperone